MQLTELKEQLLAVIDNDCAYVLLLLLLAAYAWLTGTVVAVIILAVI